MELIRSFENLNRKDVGSAGGKGASLGEMTQAKIPVPHGFVILANVFEEFLKETDLNVEIDSILHSVNLKEINTIKNASEKIKSLIIGENIPEIIKKEIQKSFKKLNAKFIAVRSSATAEDGSSAAWAGQLESFLNTTEENLFGNVKKCWASLFTSRAIFYRFEKGLHKQKISVAVVVQKMVESEISGIAFSVHPITQDPNQIVIEAGLGLGEAIVSGQITPDDYIVKKKPFHIFAINVNIQKRGLYGNKKGGNEWKKIKRSEEKKQALTDSQILKLSKIILSIEKHYHFPCDIEWAFEKNKFYIVQSRPITTLGSDKKEVLNVEKYRYFGFWPTSPFAAWFWIDWKKSDDPTELKIEKLCASSIFFRGGHYLILSDSYLNIENFVRTKIKNHAYSFFSNFKKHAVKAFNRYKKETNDLNWEPKSLNDFNLIISKAYSLMFFWIIGHLFSESLQNILDELIIQDKNSAFDLNSLKPSSKTIIQKYFDEIKKIRLFLEKKNGSKNINKKKLLFLLEKDASFHRMIAKIVDEYVWIKSFKFIGRSLNKNDVLEDIVGYKKNNTNIKLRNLNEDFTKIIAAYNDVAFSRNAAAEWFSHFSFNFSPFLRKVSNKLKIDYPALLLLTPKETAAVFFKKKTSYLSKIKKRTNDNWILFKDSSTNNVLINDNPVKIEKFYQKYIEKYAATPLKNSTSIIRGKCANSGKVEGVVKIILNQNDFSKFSDGNILVTTMTTPDFVVLMKKASAIITDIGGLLTHAGIVSRELDIPCIVGTQYATKILKDGDVVELDARNGVIKIKK